MVACSNAAGPSPATSTAYACSRRPFASTVAATGSSSTTRIRMDGSAGRDPKTLDNLGLNLRDEPTRLVRIVAAGAERIRPLLVAEPAQQAAGPLDVGQCDGVEDVAVDATVIELRLQFVIDSNDETLLFESCQIVARPLTETAQPKPPQECRVRGLSKRRAEIAHHEPAPDAVHGRGQFVDLVVRRLPVPAVEDQIGNDEATERPRPDERILVPRPVADDLLICQRRTESPGRLWSTFSAGQRPLIQVIDRRLMKTHRPEDS